MKEILKPRPITRDLELGYPGTARGRWLHGEEGKVLYVWFDAPIGYVSASRREWAEKTGRSGRLEAPTGVSPTTRPTCSSCTSSARTTSRSTACSSRRCSTASEARTTCCPWDVPAMEFLQPAGTASSPHPGGWYDPPRGAVRASYDNGGRPLLPPGSSLPESSRTASGTGEEYPALRQHRRWPTPSATWPRACCASSTSTSRASIPELAWPRSIEEELDRVLLEECGAFKRPRRARRALSSFRRACRPTRSSQCARAPTCSSTRTAPWALRKDRSGALPPACLSTCCRVARRGSPVG